MTNILVLISRLSEYRLDNHSLIPNALFSLGHRVHVGDIETISMDSDGTYVDAFQLDRVHPQGVPFPDFRLEMLDINEAIDLVWVLANPHPSVFVETYQILWTLNQTVRFVNRADSLFYLNSKICLSAAVPTQNLPDWIVSSRDSDFFARIDSGEQWVLKPANEGCGADVYFVAKNDRNTRSLVQSATGNETSRVEMYGPNTIGLARRFATMQRYADNVVENEKRVILCGVTATTGFTRSINEIDPRGNVTLGTKFGGMDLTEEEDLLCKQIGSTLVEKFGIHFSGIDMAYPYVFELNLVNPGGINYALRATGIDDSERTVSAVLQSVGVG